MNGKKLSRLDAYGGRRVQDARNFGDLDLARCF